MAAEQQPRPRIKRFPPGDQAFKATVESSLGMVGGRPIDDEGVLAAVQALVRTTYPLASLRVRFEGASPARSWDAFRDEPALDREMVIRARGGDSRALGDLFDRHHGLAYRIAVRLTEDPIVASSAVTTAFDAMVADRDATLAPQIRLGIASRDAAIQSTPDRVPARVVMARTVVELAHFHALSASEIAAVLRLSRDQVAALAIEGLRRSSGSLG